MKISIFPKLFRAMSLNLTCFAELSKHFRRHIYYTSHLKLSLSISLQNNSFISFSDLFYCVISIVSLTQLIFASEKNVDKIQSMINHEIYKSLYDICICNPFILNPSCVSEFVEIIVNKTYSPKNNLESELPTEYDPYALADFFDVAQHPVDDGLLVGYNGHGIPIMITDQDLETLTDENLINKICCDPHFHEYKDGFSLKRIQVAFPDFKIPSEVVKRNFLPSPGQITSAFLVIDDKQQTVYKKNGEKAIYFLRPLRAVDLSVIQEMEKEEKDWDMEEERKNKEIEEDFDETDIYDGRLKSRGAFDKHMPPDKGFSALRNPEWPEGNHKQQGYFRNDIQRRITYTQFWLLIRENRIEKVQFTNDYRSLWVKTKANSPGGSCLIKVAIPFDPQLLDHLLLHRVKVENNETSLEAKFLVNVARILLPIILAVYIQKYLYNLGQQQKSSEDIFAQARLEKYKGKFQIGATFDDVAGNRVVKNEMLDIIEFLRNPKKFIEMGCITPAGILLAGPPGTGKTLMAKAVGGEAGVPFFSAAGTEFAEVYNGVGASRVRDMFEIARKNVPCILFIDEFDSIGKARENGINFGNDENVATINQLLTELDGFEENKGILVMAATNRPSALDEAVTRPGRFDRIITMGLPNNEGRSGIYKVHARNIKVANSVEWHLLARASVGFSGAEIMNVINIAATLTVQANESVVSQERMFEAIEKAITEKTNKGIIVREEKVDEEIITIFKRRQVAVYLAAKGLLAYIIPLFDEIIKIICCPSNQPNGQVFVVPQEEEIELGASSKSYFESSLVVKMAGRAAEKLVLGPKIISILAENDLTSAYFLARDMVFKYGFGRRIGSINLIQFKVDYLRNNNINPLAGIDPFTASLGAADIVDILTAAEAKAFYGLTKNYQSLEALSSLLDCKHSLEHEEIKQTMEINHIACLPSPFMAGFSFDPNLSRFENVIKPLYYYMNEAIRRVKKHFNSLIEGNKSIKGQKEFGNVNNCLVIILNI